MTAAKAELTVDGMLFWHCPGCKGNHGVPIEGGHAWGWNKSLTSPTLSPSVLVWAQDMTKRCHFFIKEGKIVFLTDCFHEFAAKTVAMEDEK